MSVSRPLFSVIGVMLLLSIIMAYFVNEYWLLMIGFIGVALFQVPFTKICPLDIILKKMNL